MTVVPIKQKYALTIKEASAYFSIGIKKMRRLAEEKDEAGNLPAYSIFAGNRYLIIRHLFEEYLMETKEV